MFANKPVWTMFLGMTAIVTSLADGATLYQPMKPPFVTWIEQGQARARVVAEKGADDPAAKELNTWLKRVTGVALPVVAAPNADGPNVLLAGQQAWDRLGVEPQTLDLGSDGYVIRSVDRDLVIAGKTELGTLFGVYAFLEHYLDCRWFWPGENGMFYPSRSALRVGQIDEVSRPDFRVRWVIRAADCARFNRLNAGIRHPDEFRIKWFVHTWLSLVPPRKHWTANPEYYAEIGGKRKDPTAKRAQVNLCTANPRVADAAAETIDDIVRGDPSVRMVSVDPMDTQQFCQCDQCRQLYDKDAPYERKASRLVFDFSNRVAERVAAKHPRLLIKTIAYHTYLAPPEDPAFRLHDNVAIQFCRFMCHNHRLDDAACSENRHFHSPLVAWCKLAKNVMLYEYYYKASWCGLPWPIVHALRHDIPYLRGLGVMGIATQWDHNSAANGLGFYVASKLLWDADLDVDALLADFYEKAYRAASGPMRQYHERLEQAALASGIHFATQRPYRDMLRLFTGDLLAELDGCLRAAEQRVRNPKAAERVKLMRKNWRYCKLVHDYLTAVQHEVGTAGQNRWYGSLAAKRTAQVAQLVQPLANQIKAFLLDKANAGAVHGFGGYEKGLVAPRTVVGVWYLTGDRPSEDAVLDKRQWLAQHEQAPQPRPSTCALWIYGNDLDWVAQTGPEHVVYIKGRSGQRVKVGEIGRPDRRGDRVNMCFVLRSISLAPFPGNALDIVIDNPSGGPYASRVFAVYVMPDDETGDDQAQDMIEQDVETARAHALGFVEFGYNGRWSRESSACAQTIALPGLAPD